VFRTDEPKLKTRNSKLRSAADRALIYITRQLQSRRAELHAQPPREFHRMRAVAVEADRIGRDGDVAPIRRAHDTLANHAEHLGDSRVRLGIIASGCARGVREPSR